MELSARNQIPGRIVSVTKDGIMAEIRVEVEPGQITAAITAGSATALDLKEGDRVTVVIKATEVLIGK
ncbi:MAG: TOBE domain-containing protein [Candidatus Dormibacteraceae bacterium]